MIRYWIRWLVARLKLRRRYDIGPAYYHRQTPRHFDDTGNEDEWQREVYDFAAKVFSENGYLTILDVGCGSAFKLISNFPDARITGVELEPTLSWLRRTYPAYTWLAAVPAGDQFDLVICSDVIEHVPDPDALMKQLSLLHFRHLVLSTPDRSLIGNRFNKLGPPLNPCHCREWTFDEFEKYVGRYFRVQRHFISSHEQKTQVILCVQR